MRKRLFSSIFAVIFFISFSFPQYNYASVSSSLGSSSVDSQLSDMGYEDLLVFRVQLLTPIISTMSQALGRLHTEYPDYFEFWHQLLAHVPETDRRGSQVHEVLHEAETIFAALATYSQAYQSEIVKAEEQIIKGTDIDLEALTFQQASIDTLLGILDRLCQYEAFSQDLLADLYRMGIGVLSDYVAPSAFQKLNDFEKLRKNQLIKYFKERLIYENATQMLSALESLYNNDTRELFQSQAKHYLDLSEEITNRNKIPGSQASKLLRQEIKQLAATKARGFLAMDATFSEGDDGQAWSILFSPASGNKAQISTDNLDQRRMARHLIDTLEAMRPSLRSLVDTLISRNEVFFQDAFIENDRLRQLRESLALETIRLVRFNIVDKEISAAQLSLDKVTENDRIAALYSEIGYLKEDILSFEASILQELIFLNDSGVLNSHPGWPLIRGFIEKHREWNESWSIHATNWEESVKVFREYQVIVLKRYTAALQIIGTDIKRARQELQSNPNTETAKFIHFFDREILQLLAETQGMLLKKQEMVNCEEKDPIFASLFGINSERFWHDFRGQGIGFWRLEKLIQSKEEITDHFRALSAEDKSDFEWPLRMIKIADALDIVQDVVILEDETSVVFGTGPDALTLKGLLGLDTPTLEATSFYSQTHSDQHQILKTLSAIFSPRQAHAGFLSGVKKWAGAVANQVKRNAVNYAVIGAIAVGSLAAGPAAPVVAAAALAAFKAQATADVAIATARTAGDGLVSDPNVRKTMNSRIDKLETAYNISKIVEGGANLWKGYSGQKEITKGAVKFSDRISAILKGLKGKQGELIRKATKIRDFLNQTTRSAATIQKANQILGNIAAEANGIRIAIEQGGKNVAGAVNQFIAAAEAGLKANEAGGVLATLYGLLPGGDDKKEDGKPETDSDGDGTPDKKDGCAADPKKTAPGVCGCGAEDTDSDNDGTPDCNDDCPNDANKTDPGVCGCGTEDTDSDGDGTPDCSDDCPNDANKTAPGDCGCGEEDTDSDNDGTPDCSDDCPNDANKTDPGDCGCGAEDTDSDNDGTPDCNDDCPNDANKTAPGDCGCGTEDTDSDQDGTPDCNDDCPNDANKTDSGVCGCGTEDTDSDKDGTPDCKDKCPGDPDKTHPGECGCGIPDDDSNVNGVADCKETKKSGCASDSECPQGYVCNAGQCVSPFDDNYTSRNQAMASNEQNRQRETTEQNVADANLDPNEGKYTSDQSDEEIKKTQEALSTECGPNKPCPDPNKYECVDGKCVKRKDDEKQECKNSSECPDGGECVNGKCVKKVECESDNDCPDGKKCQNGQCVKKTGCDTDGDCPSGQKCQNGKCIKKGCTGDNDCKKGYRCKNGKCVKKGCKKHTDCKKGYRCKNDKCVKMECTKDSHCKSGYRCRKGKCVKKPSRPPADYCPLGPDNNGDGICDICGKMYR